MHIPYVVRPYPKINQKSTIKTGKAKVKSSIYTNTPEKQRYLRKTKNNGTEES